MFLFIVFVSLLLRNEYLTPSKPYLIALPHKELLKASCDKNPTRDGCNVNLDDVLKLLDILFTSAIVIFVPRRRRGLFLKPPDSLTGSLAM